MASKWMSLLSMSTVLLGAASITATVTINHNVSRYVDDLLKKFGGPTLRIGLASDSRHSFDYNDIEYIQLHPSVAYGLPERISDGLHLRYQGSNFEGELKLMDDRVTKSDPLKVISGRPLTPLDRDSTNAIISKQLARRLNIPFIPDSGVQLMAKLGDRAMPVRLVGIYELDDVAVYDAGEMLTRELLYSALDPQVRFKHMIIRGNSLEELANIEAFVRFRYGPTHGSHLKITSSKEKIDRIRSDFDSMLLAGYALGALSLLSGSLGMMNVMLLNVRLRRREIGLYRAMGFRSAHIKNQFLSEFIILSGLGSLLGGAAGSGFGMVMSELILSPFGEFSDVAIVAGIGITLVSGAVFGLIPAGRAVRLNPAEALRS